MPQIIPGLIEQAALLTVNSLYALFTPGWKSRILNDSCHDAKCLRRLIVIHVNRHRQTVDIGH